MAVARGLSAGEVPDYTLVTLPNAEGLTVHRSRINDQRQVILTKLDEAFPGALFHRGYFWSSDESLRPVFLPNGPATARLFDLNEKGQAVGARRGAVGTNFSVPFLWDEDAGPETIFSDFFQAPDFVRSLALNDFEQVVGTLGNSLLESDAFNRIGFFWEAGRDPTPIPEFRQAADINNLGQIVGQSSDTRTALLRQPDGSFEGLGTLSGDSESAAYDVNELGVVVGASGNVESQPTAFLWSGGTMTSLDPSGKFARSVAYSVNDLGEIVGVGTTAEGRSTGWLWRDGTLWTFDELIGATIGGPELNSFAFDINNHGDIVGANPVSDFVLLRASPIPEPSTLMFPALGIVLVAALAKRRRRKRSWRDAHN